jgi:cell division protein FtsW
VTPPNAKSRVETNLLVLVTLALLAFGLVMVFSATSGSATVRSGNPMQYLMRQGIYAALGLAGMVVLARLDFRRLRLASTGLLGVAIGLLLVVLVVGNTVNGAKSWIGVGPLTFQPAELAKLAIVIWAAATLARRRPPQTTGELLKPWGAVLGLIALLLMAQPDLGTLITIAVMVGGMLVIAGTPLRLLGLTAAVIVGAGLFFTWLEPYRRARVFSFLDPWADPQGSGFQTVQALIGLGSGGIFGVGLGNGVQKIFYLPEAHTDMIFAIIGEELGLVGGIAVIAGFVLFAYAGFRIALACKDPFGKRLAAGITVLISGEAAINLAAVLGLAPLTGIPLPLVSYGGTALVTTLLSVGVLINIGRSHAVAQKLAAVPDRSRGDSGSRPAGTGDRRSASAAGRARDVGRVAGSRRSASRH